VVRLSFQIKLEHTFGKEAIMDLGLKGKIAIVIGASRGIGRATALELAKEGTHIVTAGIDEYYDYYTVDSRGKNLKIEELEAVSREIRELGVQSIAVKADISKKSEVENLVGKTMAKFGRIDICVNAAAVSIPEEFEKITEECWNLHYEVCLLGAWYMCESVLPIMKKQGLGRIINISTASAIVPLPLNSAYNTFKAGLIALTKSLVAEYAPFGITTNCVLPGPTDTLMAKGTSKKFEDAMKISTGESGAKLGTPIPTGRPNKPEEIAYTICFLASDKAAQITGASIIVSGGILII
jgi:3-oxoacyl-[acyl-carrier protein] reductase